MPSMISLSTDGLLSNGCSPMINDTDTITDASIIGSPFFFSPDNTPLLVNPNTQSFKIIFLNIKQIQKAIRKFRINAIYIGCISAISILQNNTIGNADISMKAITNVRIVAIIHSFFLLMQLSRNFIKLRFLSISILIKKTSDYKSETLFLRILFAYLHFVGLQKVNSYLQSLHQSDRSISQI